MFPSSSRSRKSGGRSELEPASIHGEPGESRTLSSAVSGSPSGPVQSRNRGSLLGSPPIFPTPPSEPVRPWIKQWLIWANPSITVICSSCRGPPGARLSFSQNSELLSVSEPGDVNTSAAPVSALFLKNVQLVTSRSPVSHRTAPPIDSFGPPILSRNAHPMRRPEPRKAPALGWLVLNESAVFSSNRQFAATTSPSTAAPPKNEISKKKSQPTSVVEGPRARTDVPRPRELFIVNAPPRTVSVPVLEIAPPPMPVFRVIRQRSMTSVPVLRIAPPPSNSPPRPPEI